MSIYVNQVGYLPVGKKHATISGEKAYSLLDSNNNVVLSGAVDKLVFDDASGEETAVIDFSSVTTAGTYHFKTESGSSCSFVIGENVYDALTYDSLKMFYFQRCGSELLEKYAGRFARKACHTGKVSVLRNPEIVFECSGGWHDAGDFGRYTTAAAVALAHLLYAYELNKDKLSFDFNIPETGNGTPDILNECRYELEWLLKMQLEDGSVYHKCTSIRHTDFLMPDEDPLPFIVTPVSSMAVADFAAVCALSERHFRPFDKDFADTLKNAALKAFGWLESHPALLFNEPKECTTGDYGDSCDIDERMWAIAEIARMTGRTDLQGTLFAMTEYHISTTALGWRDVGGLAALCVLTDKDNTFNSELISVFKSRWIDEADRLMTVCRGNGFEHAQRATDIRWGSNMGVLLNAFILIYATELTGDSKYIDAGSYQLDYILGRNPMNVSYVTGHGERAFRNPHNRPTASDGIDDPTPGFVSGGPNGRPCDEAACKAIPANTAPMKCYLDEVPSYSTNEITIYWNSPLVLILGYLK